MESIGSRIRAVRKEKRKLSQEGLARRADVSLNVVSRLERGEITDPHFSTLSKIASGLGVTMDELTQERPSSKASAPTSSTIDTGQDEERRQREVEREAQAAAWAEVLANDLVKLEYSLRTPPVDHVSIGKEAHHLYARNEELRLLYETIESTKQLSTSLREAKSWHEAAWERVHPLMLQYMDIGAVPDRVREVPRREAKEQRPMREPTNEQEESAG